MILVIDMNLSPLWVQALADRGWQAVHWSTVGNPRAKDSEIMEWARSTGYVVFTHDLDFGAILAATGLIGPSVLQVRAQDVTPDHLGNIVSQALHKHRDALERGALVTVDETRSRVRILPFPPRA